jgi:hypothetical protein
MLVSGISNNNLVSAQNESVQNRLATSSGEFAQLTQSLQSDNTTGAQKETSPVDLVSTTGTTLSTLPHTFRKIEPPIRPRNIEPPVHPHNIEPPVHPRRFEHPLEPPTGVGLVPPPSTGLVPRLSIQDTAWQSESVIPGSGVSVTA